MDGHFQPRLDFASADEDDRRSYEFLGWVAMTPIEKAQAKSDALKALGLSGQARPGEIRAAWKRLAFETHPDRNGGALDAFAEARAAYDLLASQLPARQETGAAQPRGPSGSGADRVAMGRRPSVAGKVTEFPEATLERCRALLEDGASADAPART